MGRVIGPFKPEDWLLLGTLKQSVDYMKSRRESKYDVAIAKETKMFDEILGEYLTSEAA